MLVNPEAHSCTLCLERLRKLVNFGDIILISTLITTVVYVYRVKHANIIKLKRYIQNGLMDYQTKYCKNTFVALPHLSCT